MYLFCIIYNLYVLKSIDKNIKLTSMATLNYLGYYNFIDINQH